MSILKITALAALTATSALADSTNSTIRASLSAGYESALIVNGLSVARSSAFSTVAAGVTYHGVDFDVGGTFLPVNGGLDQSHWFAGVGTSVPLGKSVSVHLDADVLRHNTTLINYANSTELSPSLALENKFLTPYVRYSYNVDSGSKGFFVGLRHEFNTFFDVKVTPALEYGRFTSYEVFQAKLGVTRKFGAHLTAFAEGTYLDNSFDSNLTFSALKRLDLTQNKVNGEFLGSAGLRWNF